MNLNYDESAKTSVGEVARYGYGRTESMCDARSARAADARVAEHAMAHELRPRLFLEVVREAQRVLRTRDARFAKRCEPFLEETVGRVDTILT